jgi:hypothetical protein
MRGDAAGAREPTITPPIKTVQRVRMKVCLRARKKLYLS